MSGAAPEATPDPIPAQFSILNLRRDGRELASFAGLQQWVIWKLVKRGDQWTKAPFSPWPPYGFAKSNDRNTWGTRAQAEAATSAVAGASIGIMLGPLEDDERRLIGIDLDTCIDAETGKVETWAAELIRRFATYGEISPSGRGVKLFLLCTEHVLDTIRPYLGEGKYGKKWSKPGKDHPPAIEIYYGNRFFALTERHVPGTPEAIHIAFGDDLLKIHQVIGPSFAGQPCQFSPKEPPPDSCNSNAKENSNANCDGSANPEAETSEADLLARIMQKSALHPRLRQRWSGDFTGLADQSRSGRAMAIGAALKAAGFTFEEMVAALRLNPHTREWVEEKGSADNDRELHRIWNNAEQPNGREHAGNQHTAANNESKDGPADLDGFDLHEDGLAQAFTAKYQDNLRFCWDAGKWYRWTGNLWQRDRTKIAFSWARKVCRQLADESGAPDKLKSILAKAATAAAVEKYAQAEVPHSVTSEIWDTDPLLLGTPRGTIDLRTGELREARREDYITKATAITPSATPDCDLWLQFLNEACGQDAGLIRFLQQFSGYLLTGDTREHALLFIYGPGGNGKSVWLNTVAGILGDYCRIAAMETFTASASDRHPTDLAMLQGARMVCASETEEGRAWAEVRIKQLTGGDTITARFMRRDFFEYRPQFKLVVIGNHKPALRNVDDAARRRFNIVPFVHKPANPDRELEQKLRAEWPGILRWMIDGCMDWQRNGLVRPQIVVDATREYFDEQDLVRRWIEECCETGDPRLSDTTKHLFKSWSDYALANGERPGTSKWFAQVLLRQGYRSIKHVPGNHSQRGFEGIRVMNVDTWDQWQNRTDAEDGLPF